MTRAELDVWSEKRFVGISSVKKVQQSSKIVQNDGAVNDTFRINRFFLATMRRLFSYSVTEDNVLITVRYYLKSRKTAQAKKRSMILI